VQSKGVLIREMLQKAAAQRTTNTPKQPKQPKFQFHVNKELQKQLHISTRTSYSSMAAQNCGQKKQITIVQPAYKNVQQNTQQQQTKTTDRTT
jgi:hypothetical protein